MRPLTLLLLPLLAACSAAAPSHAAAPAVVVAGSATAIPVPAGAFTATMVRDVDGDTALFTHGGAQVRVRFLGMDTPETVKPNTPVRCWGEQASAETKALLPVGTVVHASYEPGGNTDRYGRDLWDIWLPDGRFLNGLLVDGGFARAEQVGANKLYAPQIAAAAAAAKAAKVGLWGPPCNGNSFG